MIGGSGVEDAGVFFQSEYSCGLLCLRVGETELATRSRRGVTAFST